MGVHGEEPHVLVVPARRAYQMWPIDESNYAELASRIDAYIAEFEEHGTDNILVDIDN